MSQYFTCQKCNNRVDISGHIGTRNRNHCPKCLYSKHVDKKKPGDRESECRGMMEPIDITFKKNKKNKYGIEKRGEIMIVHKCKKCSKKTNNRLAGDDNNNKVIDICKDKENIKEIKTQLYGNTKTGF